MARTGGVSSKRLEEGALLNGRYAIQEVVGRGGMGTVYRALDTRLEIPVAVKEMTEKHSTFEERATAIRQFEREAKTLGQLHHANLPRVTDYFVEQDHCYLIMEFVVGETLDAKLRKIAPSPLPLADVLDWSVQIADVLAYLHNQDPPIVFRDIKPANIMVEDNGTVKLIDFGIARRFSEGATKDTLLYGSPGYSPPEQYGRSQTDPRSDIYAFGATLHHLASGRDPSPTPFRFPALRTLQPEAPPALETFVARCVEMEEEKRIQTADDARDQLIHIRTTYALAQRASGDRPAAQPGPVATPSTSSQARRPSVPIIVSTRVQQAQDRRLLRRLLLFAPIAILIFGSPLLYRKYFAQPKQPSHVSGPVAPPEPTPVIPEPRVDQPPPQAAQLRITTDPAGAAVNLDGKLIGNSPVAMSDIPPGKHLIKLEPPEGSGYAVAMREIEVARGSAGVVHTTLSALPSTGADVPAALLDGITSADVRGIGRQPAGVRITFNLRVTGGNGKQGTLGVFFYSVDQKPLQPPAGSEFQSQDGQLAAFAPFKADSGVVDFPEFSLFVPEGAFPAGVSRKGLLFRVEAFLDDRLVGQSDLLPLQPATSVRQPGLR